MSLVSRIYHMASGPAPTGEQAEARNLQAYRDAWHQRGLAVFDVDAIGDDWLRRTIEAEAVRRYGQRKARGQ